MTIDIIDLSSPEYADLSAVQLSMVRVAQAKKDKITKQLARDIEAYSQQFSINHIIRSTALTQQNDLLQKTADEEVETIRDDLVHQLAYEALGSEGNANGPYRYPENPNYTLTYSQRFLIVREYYMNATGDASARLEAYRMDSLARQYLGEFYETLYDLLASYV